MKGQALAVDEVAVLRGEAITWDNLASAYAHMSELRASEAPAARALACYNQIGTEVDALGAVVMPSWVQVRIELCTHRKPDELATPHSSMS
jgi:hypothetical protein